MVPLIVGINAKFIHTNNAIRLLKANSRFDVEILEFTIKDTLDEVIEKITDEPRLFIAFSCYIWNIEMIKALVFRLKKTTNTPIILGGPEVSYDANTFLDTWPIDMVIKGEGEDIIDDVIQHYQSDIPLINTPGIATKTFQTPPQEITNLKTLKSPHYFDFDQPNRDKRIAYIESSRGCPYRCSYCLSSLEKTVRFFPLESVRKDLIYLIEAGVKYIKFLDRTFNANPDALAIIDTIIKHRRDDLSVQFEMTGDTLNDSLIQYIHTHAPKGLFRFEIGIQSTHDKTNLLVGRKQNNDRLFKTIKNIIQHDIIDLHLDLIAGLPKEDLSRFKKTFDSVYNLGAKELQLGFLKMLRGTKIREEAQVYGYQYAAIAPYEVISHNDLCQEDIRTIKKVMTILDICHNKGYFGNHFFQIIKQHYPSAFDVFLRMHAVCDHKILNRHYQLEDLFEFVTRFFQDEGLNQMDLDAFKPYYLRRNRVKPKGYFPKIKEKKLRRTILEKCADKYQLDINDLYKHSLITSYQNHYLVAYYKHQAAYLYPIK